MSVKIRYRQTKRIEKDEQYSVYLDIYHKGKRTYEYPEIYVSDDYAKKENIKKIDKEKIDLVQAIKAKIELSLKNGQYGFETKYHKSGCFIAFFDEMCNKKKHSSYWCTLNKLKYHFGDKLTFDNCTKERMEDFIEYLSECSISQNTQYHYLKLVNVAFNDAVRKNLIGKNPLHFLTPKEKPARQESKREFLTIEELRLLNKTEYKGNEHVKIAFLFACYVGFRVSDLKNLRWTDITAELTSIQYRQRKETRQFHHLPINDTARELLKELEKPERGDLVFWKLPSSMSYCNMLIRIWAAEAGVKKHVSWHVARHTYACLLLNNGADIYTVSKLMGHHSVEVTEIYGKIINEHKKKVVNLLPSL